MERAHCNRNVSDLVSEAENQILTTDTEPPPLGGYKALDRLDRDFEAKGIIDDLLYGRQAPDAV